MFLILLLMSLMGQSRPDCMTTANVNVVKINVGFRVGWFHNEIPEGFIVQLDKGAQLIVRPKPGVMCPPGTDYADYYPYTYIKATGITEGKHTFSVSAFNTVVVNGVSKKDIGPPSVIEVIGIK